MNRKSGMVRARRYRRRLRETVKACACRGGRAGQSIAIFGLGLARNLGGEPNRVVACCYLLSERILWGGYR